MRGLRYLEVLSAKAVAEPPRLQLPAQLSCCIKLADMRISTAQLPACVFNMVSLTSLLLDQARPAPDDLQAASRLTCLQDAHLPQ